MQDNFNDTSTPGIAERALPLEDAVPANADAVAGVKSRQEKMNDMVDNRLDSAIQNGLRDVVRWALEYAELAYRDDAAARKGDSDVYFQARTVIDKLKGAHYKDLAACTEDCLKNGRRNAGELAVSHLLESLDKGRPPRLIVNELCREYLHLRGNERKPAPSGCGMIRQVFGR